MRFCTSLFPLWLFPFSLSAYVYITHHLTHSISSPRSRSINRSCGILQQQTVQRANTTRSLSGPVGQRMTRQPTQFFPPSRPTAAKSAQIPCHRTSPNCPPLIKSIQIRIRNKQPHLPTHGHTPLIDAPPPPQVVRCLPGVFGGCDRHGGLSGRVAQLRQFAKFIFLRACGNGGAGLGDGSGRVGEIGVVSHRFGEFRNIIMGAGASSVVAG